MLDKVLLEETIDAVRILTLNRPNKRNALNTQLTQDLLDGLSAAQEDDSIKVILLVANGQDFCAGADVSEFSQLEKTADHANTRAALTTALHKKFREVNKPIVGAAQGNMMGGGAGLATACDLLILGQNSRIGYPEVSIGIVPAIVMANLAQQIGPKHAFELIITGKPINAETALQIGLANRVVANEDLFESAKNIALDISKNSSKALEAIKSLFYTALDHTFHEAMEFGAEMNVKMRGFNQR
jgi:enoyl-CoA hydratase/carnithine racemase